MWHFETKEGNFILGTKQPKEGLIWNRVKPAEPSENTEQLKTKCSHKHWERQETGTQLIHKICSTCGAEKFD
jgi:hypothetical protein